MLNGIVYYNINNVLLYLAFEELILKNSHSLGVIQKQSTSFCDSLLNWNAKRWLVFILITSEPIFNVVVTLQSITAAQNDVLSFQRSILYFWCEV